MRRTAVEIGALAVLLLGGALAVGQQPAPPATTAPAAADKPKDEATKSKLEEMLQQALQNNPDLRLAAAKVVTAEAELNRARLQVVQKVGAAYQAIEAQKAVVEGAAAEMALTKVGVGVVPIATVRAAEQKLIEAKAKLAALETEMPYLIGKQPGNNSASLSGPLGGAGSPGSGFSNPAASVMAGAMGQWGGGFGALGGGLGALGGGFGALGGGLGGVGGAFGGLGGGPPNNLQADDAPKPVPVLGKTAERIQAALNKPFSLELKKTKLVEVIADVSAAFQKANPGLLIKCNISPDQLDNYTLESVKFEEMPFGAVLVWIEDSAAGSGVVIRDYGLVIAPADNLPPGAPTLHDFWKGEKGEDK